MLEAGYLWQTRNIRPWHVCLDTDAICNRIHLLVI
jgi:hypothetical protein